MLIDWSNNIEPEQRIQIEAAITQWLWLLPTWCRKLCIHVSEELGNDVLAATESNQDYRWCSLAVSTIWFNRKSYDRDIAIIHELLHYFSHPLYFYAINEINRSDNELYKEVVKAQLESLNEQQAQDMAYMLYYRWKTETEIQTASAGVKNEPSG